MKWAHPKTCGIKRRRGRHEDEIAFSSDMLSPQFFVHTGKQKNAEYDPDPDRYGLLPADAPIFVERRRGTRVWKVGEEPKEDRDEV